MKIINSIKQFDKPHTDRAYVIATYNQGSSPKIG